MAIAASGPVNLLSRKLPRGAAIAIVYLGIVFVPIVIGLILIPPAVEQGVKLANNLPEYAQELNEAFDENPQLREANEKYDITTKLENLAEDLVTHARRRRRARSWTSAPASSPRSSRWSRSW